MNSAPFRYTKNTTIQNLKMAGDMYVSGQFAGALIRVNYGTSNITNCRVSTVIHCSYKGVGNHGGLVSVVRSGTLTITGCVFDAVATAVRSPTATTPRPSALRRASRPVPLAQATE